MYVSFKANFALPNELEGPQ